MGKLVDKLLEHFRDDELKLTEISAIKDEDKMRDCIEKCLKRFPINGKKIAVETGTYHGLSAALLAEYFDEVHTFEIATGYFIDLNIKDRVWNYLEISNRIHFYLINNDVEKTNILKNIKYDFAFIDGNHSTGTMIDFKLMKGSGRILFHDYNPEKARIHRGMWLKVYNFINSLDTYYKNPPFVVWVNKYAK